MSQPPIPARLARRPLHAGLVIPWVSVVLGDGTPVLGNLHGTKTSQALLGKLCQICGQRLGDPLVLFATESGFERGQTSEPAMHPECAAYSAKACPMVNGSMRHYQITDRVDGQPCSLPGCNCDGWVSHNGGKPKEPRPADRWVAVWLHDYAVGVDPATEIPNAAIWKDLFQPLKVRPIQPAAAREEARR